MAKDPSFDIVSEVNLQEVDNAVNQALKEISTRFDFKGSKSDISMEGAMLTIVSEDDYKIGAVLDVLQSKLVKRGVSLKSLKNGKIESSSGGMVRQVITIQQGIDQEIAKQVSKLIRDSKLKVQASIQGDQVRCTAKSKDDLQAVMELLRESEIPTAFQFVNYR